MPDDKSKTGKSDRTKINTSEDYEVKYWSTKFGVSSMELLNAVKKVGNDAKSVESFLKKK